VVTEVDRIVSGADAALKLLFPGGVPGWVHVAEGAVLALLVLMVAGLTSIRLLVAIVQEWRQRVVPLFNDRQKQPLGERRSWLARKLDERLKLLGRQEEWLDHRFTELEAEVESESRRRLRFVLLRGGRARPPERCRAPAE
jgi:hypothetical protein